MKKISRFIAFALALIMLAGTFATVSAATVEETEETAWDSAISQLYDWGIIDEADVLASKDDTKILDRQVFALWTAKVLIHEFGTELWQEIDKATTNEDGYKTGYDDVDDSQDALYRRAIAYVTANGLFEGYGVDAYGKNKFGPVYTVYEDGYCEGAVEFYQACKVVISLLTRWEDESNTTYIDDVVTYDRYFGDGTQRSEGTAYLWKALDLGIVDSYYMDNCNEYFWDSDLNYGEAAYILVKAIRNAKPADCNDGCDHGDANGNGIKDCYIEDSLSVRPREGVLTGFVKAPVTGDVLTNENVTLAVLVGDGKYADVTFTAEEFAKIAIDENGKVDLTTGEKGYEVNTIVSIEYYGNLRVLEKAAGELTAKEVAVIKEGIMNAYDEETKEATVVPVAGYSYYSTYLVNTDGAQSVRPETNKVTYDAASNKLTYKGVEYTVATAEAEVTGNKIIARKNGIDLAPSEVSKYFRNLAQGEMAAVFYDIQKDGSAYEYVELVSCKDFAPMYTGINSVLDNGKALSYLLYDRTIEVAGPLGLAFAISGIDYEADLKIAVCNVAADSKIYSYYEYTSVYYKADTAAKFGTVAGVVKSVEDAENGYYKVTFEGDTFAYIPTAATLGGDIIEDFYYTIGGDWACVSVDLTTTYNGQDISWFAELSETYAAMTNIKTQLVERRLEVVVDENGKAIYVDVDGKNAAFDEFGAGYVSKVEATENKNIVKVTVNQVGENGVLVSKTFDINLALTASYNYDAKFVESLLTMIIDPTNGKTADVKQLIFAEVKTDGIGRYMLVKADDVDMKLTAADTKTEFEAEIFVSSTIYAIDGTVVRSSSSEKLSFTPADAEKNASKIVTVYAKYVADSYAYTAIKDRSGKVTGYALTPGSVKYVQKIVTDSFDGASVNWEETYSFIEVLHTVDGVKVQADATVPARVEGILDANGEEIPAEKVTYKDIVEYQQRKYWVVDANGKYVLDANGNKQKDTTKGYFYYFKDEGNNVGLPTGVADSRYLILSDGYVYKIENFKATHTQYDVDANGNIIVGEPMVKDYASSEVYSCTKNADGEWVNADGNTVNGYFAMAYNANIKDGVFTVKVGGENVSYNVAGYAVYVITPSAEGETFKFENAVDVVGELTVVSFAVDTEAKTLTIFGD